LSSIEIRSAAGRKQAIHFGAPGRELFGFFHPPKEGLWRGVGVVLVNPFGTDHTRADRPYRHLAERLAAAGFACLRFDATGTGDSGGSDQSPGLLRDWLEDLGRAVEELRARSGAMTVALAGLRLGGTLAATYAAERGGIDSLVLWSPCVSGAAFASETIKLHKLYARIEPQMAGAPKGPAGGEEALGLFLPNALIDELSQLDLLKLPKSPARRTLVIDGGGLANRDALMAHLTELGAAPALRSHPGHKFLVLVSHRGQVPDEVLESIVGWLSSAYELKTAAVTPPPRPAGPAPAGEHAVLYGKSRPLFGILTPGNPALRNAERPAIILSNAGCVNRAGPHRMYVKMARRWAALGFDVLRVDLSGIGDSPVEPGETENLTYPPSGVADLGEAIRSLSPGRIILGGLCSGGDYAYQLGASEPLVVGAWLLNPRTFAVLELAAVESGALPGSPVAEVPRTLQRMAEKGVDTLLVVSRNDPGVAYCDQHAAAEMKSLAGVAGFKRFDLEGADHSFTPVAIQERVSDLLTGNLARPR
jgi:alpha-beta hydrolase superfamily lysophospholipase